MIGLWPIVESALQARGPIRGPDRGGNYRVACVFHDDAHPSLDVHPERGFICRSCGSSGGLTKLAHALGLGPNGDGASAPRGPLTVEALADAKALPVDFLRELGVEQDGAAVRIPYRLADGSLAPRQRGRTATSAKAGSFWYPGEGSPVPYGLWRLHEARAAGYLLVAEGESDSWTAWHHGIPALGLPGADTSKLLHADHLAGIGRLYVAKESDRGGEVFAAGIARQLRELGWSGEARVVTMPDGLKDVNELHRSDPARARERLVAALETTQPLEAPASAAASRLSLTALRDLMAEPPDTTRWLVEGRLPSAGLSLLAGKPKAGKSTLARCLALAVARGEPWLGHPTVNGPVFYLALEEKRSEVRAHFAAMGGTDEDVRVFIAPAPEDGLRLLREAADQERPALIIIDPLLRFVRLRDVNDYAEVNRALEPLMTLARETGAHVLAVHHLGKGERSGGDAILGSTAIYAAVDTALLLKRSDHYRTLSSSQRYGEDLEELTLVLDPETRLVSAGPSRRDAEEQEAGAAIRDYLGGRAEPVEEAGILEAVEGRKATMERALRRLVAEGLVTRNGAGKRGDPYRYGILPPLPPTYSREGENQNPENRMILSIDASDSPSRVLAVSAQTMGGREGESGDAGRENPTPSEEEWA